MTTVLVQTALLLLLSQILLGAVGLVMPHWWAVLATALQVWLIVRIARVLRSEMLEAGKRRLQIEPWKTALWVTLLWQWPSVLLLPRGTIVPGILADLWNGAVFPLQDIIRLITTQNTADVLGPWLWIMVVVEALLFVLIAGRPLQRSVVPKHVETAVRQVAAAGEWAPARRLKDAQQRRRMAPRKD